MAGASAIDAVIAANQPTGALPDAPDNVGDPSSGTAADTTDPVLQAFYDNGASFSGAAQVGPVPIGGAGMEWAPRGWAGPTAPVTDAKPGPASSSASVATTGVTARGIKRAGGVFDQADDRAKTELGQFGEETARERSDLDQHVDEQKAAVRATSDQERIHYDNIASLERHQANLQNAWAEQDQRYRAQGKAEGAAYLSRYDQQLAGVSQLARSSGNPIDDLTRTQALGLAGAQFVQGFLAVRGVNINVSGQIDKWVDRSIQAHQQQVENARTAAGDTLHLYEIARQSSQDDAEARTKYRGMVIQGLQSQLQGEAARYQSSVAMSLAAAQSAQLDVEKDKVRRELGARAEQQFVQVHTLENNRAHEQLQASVEMAKIAEGRAARAEAAKAKGKPTQYIYGPQTLGPDGKVHSYAVGKVEPGSPDDGKRLTAANDAVKAYEELTPQLKRYASLLGKLKDDGFVGRGGLGNYAGKADNPDFQEAKALQKEIAITQTRINNGTRSSDQELQNQLDMIPMTDTLALMQGNDAVFQNFKDAQRQALNATIKANSDHAVDAQGRSGLTPEERRYEYGIQDADAPGTAYSDAFHDPNNDRKLTPAARLTAEAVATKPRDATASGDVARSALDATDPSFEAEGHHPHTTTTLSGAWLDAKGGGARTFEVEQPGWAVAQDVMAHYVLHGSASYLGDLEAIADDKLPDTSVSPVQRRYARALVDGLKSDPKALADRLAARVQGAPGVKDDLGDSERAVETDQATTLDPGF